MKKGDINEALCSRLKSTGVQPVSLYRLAKVNKQGTPLRPIFSLPGSLYGHLNKTLSRNFDKIEVANQKNNTQIAGEILEKNSIVL